MGKKGRKERSISAGSPQLSAGANGGINTPRSNDDIIGCIGPGASPSQRVVKELWMRLAYEISCLSHQQVLEKVQRGQCPITYETPGMLTALDGT
eukprot:2392962-Rhodomonas_salina.1